MKQTKDIFPKINRGFSNMKKMHRLEDNKLELQIYSNPSPESQTYTGFCQQEAGVVKRAPGSPVGLRRFSTPPQPRPHHPAGGAAASLECGHARTAEFAAPQCKNCAMSGQDDALAQTTRLHESPPPI